MSNQFRHQSRMGRRLTAADEIEAGGFAGERHDPLPMHAAPKSKPVGVGFENFVFGPWLIGSHPLRSP
jgi:hypothetical protein